MKKLLVIFAVSMVLTAMATAAQVVEVYSSYNGVYWQDNPFYTGWRDYDMGIEGYKFKGLGAFGNIFTSVENETYKSVDVEFETAANSPAGGWELVDLNMSIASSSVKYLTVQILKNSVHVDGANWTTQLPMPSTAASEVLTTIDVSGVMLDAGTTYTLRLMLDDDALGMYGYDDSNMPVFEITAVPEPATLALLGLGAVGLLRKRK